MKPLSRQSNAGVIALMFVVAAGIFGLWYSLWKKQNPAEPPPPDLIINSWHTVTSADGFVKLRLSVDPWETSAAALQSAQADGKTAVWLPTKMSKLTALEYYKNSTTANFTGMYHSRRSLFFGKRRKSSPSIRKANA